MRRKAGFILLAFMMLGTIAFFYVNNIFLPIKLKQFLSSSSERIFNRKVSIGKLSFKIIEGIVFEDIKVFQKDDPDKIFVSAEEISMKILLSPVLNKRIIIHTLNIKEPLLYASINNQNKWNFSDILSKNTTKKNKIKLFKLYVTKFHLEDGSIVYTDKIDPEPFTESLTGLDIKAHISLDRAITFSADALIPRNKSSIALKGNYNIISKKFSSHVSANNIYISKYIRAIMPGQPFKIRNAKVVSLDSNIANDRHLLEVKGNFALTDMDIITDDGKYFEGKIAGKKTSVIWDGEQLRSTGELSLFSKQLTYNDKIDLKGDTSLTLTTLDFYKKTFSTTGSIKINDAKILFQDNASLIGDLKADNIELSINKNNIFLSGEYSVDGTELQINQDTKIKCDIKPQKIDLIMNNNVITAQGGISLQKAEIINKNILTLQAAELNVIDSNIQIGKNKFIFEGNIHTAKTNVTLNKNNNLTGDISARNIDFSLENKKLTLNANAQTKNLNIKLENNIEIYDSPSVNILYEQNLDEEDSVHYAGEIELKGTNIKGIEKIDEINNINGKISFDNNSASSENLNLSTINTPMTISGSINDFKSPELDIIVASKNLDLKTASAFFSDELDKFGIEVSGKSAATINFKGNTSKIDKADISVSASISNGEIHEKNKNISATRISGDITYKKDLLTWNNLKGSHKNHVYTLFGQIENFSRPKLSAKLESKDFSAEAEVNILNEAFRVVSSKGQYHNSSFELTGDVHIPKGDEPDINLRTDFDLELNDLKSLPFDFSEKIKQYDPQGQLSGEILYRGTPKKWREWQLVINAKSPNISLMDYPFDDFKINFDQRDNNINKFFINTNIYNGNLTINSSLNLLKENIPSETSITLKDLNIAQLRKDKKIKKTDLRGFFSLESELTGPIKNLDKLKGKGSFFTKEGYLGELALIKGLISVINNIPGFLGKLISNITNGVQDRTEKITTNYITDISGDFIIEDRQFISDNIRVLGSIYDLKIVGNVGFNQTLNMFAYPDYGRFSEKYRSATELIGSPVQVKITGTISKPKYDAKFDIIKPVEDAVGTTIEVLKEVGNIFGEILK